MKLLCIKSRFGVELPPNTTLSIDGNEIEVLGLARQEERDGMIWQWWIVEEN